MQRLTDPDDAWPSVGTMRTPQTGARPEVSRMAALSPIAWLSRAVQRVTRSEDAFDVDSLIPALSSIRSSAEILRDMPDIDPAERRRFAEIVLAEEARLEVLVKKVAGGSDLARE